MTFLYSLIMAAVDLAALVFVARRKSVRAWRASLACAGMVAFLLALALAKDGFHGFRLLAYGVFLHGVVLLAGSGVIWWRTRRIIALGSAMAATGILVVAVDAFLIEPTWLEVSHRRIRSAKIDRPIRIVVLADLQTDQIGQYERDVLRRALQQEPDLLLLAGDYIQAGGPQRQQLYAQLNAFLRRLDLPEPGRVFAVQGNVDADDWPELFRGTPVVPVRSTETFELSGIQLTCLARRDSFSRSLEVNAPEADRFHLVLGHSPNFALGRIEADLLLAGHTHGGQVRLPLYGPPRLPIRHRHLAEGLFHHRRAQVYVSRGLGYLIPIRFRARPELGIIELRRA